MNDMPGAIAARIFALEQRLLVALLQGDDHARSLARAEIASLKRRLPPAASQERSGRFMRAAAAPTPAPAG